MEALFLLIPLALIFCLIAVKAFFWAVGNRQFDNLDSAAHSILFDDENAPGSTAKLPPPGDRDGDRRGD
ncbi:MAG TPA: cbb3-type cytochrome oxidase assembly protein CcoS [Spongiibacteraceae bacterium]|nr:cbb3-type cytochrome oxidase assembly protein CcoS [Spongiibacteraceae bacterium]